MRTVEVVGVVTTRSHTMQTVSSSGSDTRTRRTTVFTPDGERRDIPFISGSSLRGKLRRIAGLRLLDRVTQDGPISRDLAMNVLRGMGGRQAIARHLATPKVLASAVRHPFVGVFAGGPLMLSSNLSTHDLIPLVDWTSHLCHPHNRDACVPVTRPTEGDDWGGYVRLTTSVQFAARDDFRDGSCAPYVANHDAEFVDWVSKIANQSAVKKQDKADGKRGGAVSKTDDLRLYGSYEAMFPGTPLSLELRMDRPSDAQVGLVLDALLEWARENKLGGGAARGLGRFTVDASLLVDGDIVVDSLFTGSAPHFGLSEKTLPFREAAAAAVAGVTAADLEHFYPSGAANSKSSPTRR